MYISIQFGREITRERSLRDLFRGFSVIARLGSIPALTGVVTHQKRPPLYV